MCLPQAIGAEVSLTLFDGGMVEGTVLGLETVTMLETVPAQGDAAPTSTVVEKEVLNLLMEDDSIQAFPVLELESFGTSHSDLLRSSRCPLPSLTLFV
jgi:hypothetical protein